MLKGIKLTISCSNLAAAVVTLASLTRVHKVVDVTRKSPSHCLSRQNFIPGSFNLGWHYAYGWICLKDGFQQPEMDMSKIRS
jgi:hypothetical protein